MKKRAVFSILFMVSFVYMPNAFAWGRRGHSIICQTAAYLAADMKNPKEKTFVKEQQNPSRLFLKAHSFDLGYYCNVPDIIWKRPDSYAKERINHFLTLSNYKKEFSEGDFKAYVPFKMSRVEFAKKYKNLPESQGRSWWRIQEMDTALTKLKPELLKKKTQKEHQKDQLKWLTLVGVTGHYIGDLAMPLHVAENYDGKRTGQKGIHGHFEEKIVDYLFLQKNFGLQEAVFQKAKKMSPKYFKESQGKTLLDLLYEISQNSDDAVEKLLKKDKQTPRGNIDLSSQAFRTLVVERLAKGALLQAVFMDRHLGWNFDDDKFYLFNETPDFIEPPQ